MGICAVDAEEIMVYSVVDPQDNDGAANIASDIMILRQDRHCPYYYLYELKHQLNYKWVLLSCDVWSVE